MGVLRSILLATDFRQSSQEATGATVQLATAFGSRVTILHVREEFLIWPVSPFENQDRLTRQLAARNVDVAGFLVHAGPPADTVVGKARELDADLLVIGAGEKFLPENSTVAPIAESILERAESPVLAVIPHWP